MLWINETPYVTEMLLVSRKDHWLGAGWCVAKEELGLGVWPGAHPVLCAAAAAAAFPTVFWKKLPLLFSLFNPIKTYCLFFNMAEKLSRVSLGKSFLDLLMWLSFVPLERALGRMKDWKPDSKNNLRWQIFCLRRKLMLDGEERRAVDFLWELQKQCRVLGGSGLCHRLVGKLWAGWYSGPRLPLLYNGDKGGVYPTGHGVVSSLTCVEQVEWYGTSEAVYQCLLLQLSWGNSDERHLRGIPWQSDG